MVTKRSLHIVTEESLYSNVRLPSHSGELPVSPENNVSSASASNVLLSGGRSAGEHPSTSATALMRVWLTDRSAATVRSISVYVASVRNHAWFSLTSSL